MGNDKKDREKEEKEKKEYQEGLKKTLIPILFGLLAGIICFSIFVATPLVVTETGMAKADLDDGIVPDTLLDLLETKGYSVPENGTVEKQDTDKWLINDETGSNICIVKADGNTLNIYTSIKSEDWLLIAILIILLQKFAYPLFKTKIEGAKDWLYIGFMTLFCWFMTFTLFLSLLF